MGLLSRMDQKNGLTEPNWSPNMANPAQFGKLAQTAQPVQPGKIVQLDKEGHKSQKELGVALKNQTRSRR